MSPYHYEDFDEIDSVPYLYGTVHKWMGNDEVIWELTEGESTTVEQALEKIARKEQEDMYAPYGISPEDIESGRATGLKEFDMNIEEMIDEAALNAFFGETQVPGPMTQQDMGIAGPMVGDAIGGDALDQLLMAGMLPEDEMVTFDDLPEDVKTQIGSVPFEEPGGGLIDDPLMLPGGGLMRDLGETSFDEPGGGINYVDAVEPNIITQNMQGDPFVQAGILPAGINPADMINALSGVPNALREFLSGAGAAAASVPVITGPGPSYVPDEALPGGQIGMEDVMAGVDPNIPTSSPIHDYIDDLLSGAAAASIPQIAPGASYVPDDALPQTEFGPSPSTIQDAISKALSPGGGRPPVDPFAKYRPTPIPTTEPVILNPKEKAVFEIVQTKTLSASADLANLGLSTEELDVILKKVTPMIESIGGQPESTLKEVQRITDAQLVKEGEARSEEIERLYREYQSPLDGVTPEVDFETEIEAALGEATTPAPAIPEDPGDRPTVENLGGGHTGRLAFPAALEAWEEKRAAWNDYWGEGHENFIPDVKIEVDKGTKRVVKTEGTGPDAQLERIKAAFVKALNSDDPSAAVLKLIKEPPEEIATDLGLSAGEPMEKDSVHNVFQIFQNEGLSDIADIRAWHDLSETDKKGQTGKTSGILKKNYDAAMARLFLNPWRPIGTVPGMLASDLESLIGSYSEKGAAFSLSQDAYNEYFNRLEGAGDWTFGVSTDETGPDPDPNKAWLDTKEGATRTTSGYDPPKGFNLANGDTAKQDKNNPNVWYFTRGSGTAVPEVVPEVVTTTVKKDGTADTKADTLTPVGTDGRELLPADDWTRQMSNQDLFFSEFYKMPGSGTYDALRNRGKIWNQAETLYLLGHGLGTDEIGDATGLRDAAPKYGDRFRNFSRQWLNNPQGYLDDVGASGNTFASIVAARAQEAANKLRAFETNVENVWGVDFMDWKSRNPNATSADGYYKEVQARNPNRSLEDIEKDWTRNVEDVSLFHPYFGGDDRWRNTYKTVNTIGLDPYNASAIGNVLDLVANSMLSQGKTYGEVLQRLTRNPMGVGMRGGTGTGNTQTQDKVGG